MAIQTFTAVDSIGYGQVENIDYATARDATSADSVVDWPLIPIGQRFISPNYTIFRGGVVFNTSGLPDTAIIISAIFKMKYYTTFGLCTVRILNGQPTCPHIPMELEDFNRTKYSGNGGEDATGGGWGTSGLVTINLTNEGLSWINRTGNTKFMLMSSNDVNDIPPTDWEMASFWTTSEGKQAQLVITYFEPVEAPVVETINLACEDRQSTTLTAVGNITGSGDGYTFRGFEYYQYGEGEYDSSMWAVREIGRFHTLGEYRMTLYGLKPSTVYWIRAFAGNIFGIGYGEWVLCSTVGVQVGSYEIHEETNPATICFYVSEDSGHTWSLKFGPYTTDQADIAITKILVRGSGKKQIKFTTDALTGLSASVMCKVDVKI